MTFREGTMILWRTLKLMKKGFVKYLLAILSMSAVLSGFDAVTALLLKDLVVRMTQDQNRFAGLSRELVLCLLDGSLFLGIYAASFFVYTMEAKKGGANLQKLLYSKCLRLPYEYYEDHHSGEFLSKLIYDCDRASGIYGSRFRRIIMPFCMTCCYLGMMFWLNVEVTACLLGVSMIMFVIHGAFVKPLQRVGGRLSAANAVITEQITDLLAGMEQIKMFSLGRIMVDRFIEGNEAYYKQQQRRNLLSAEIDGLTHFFELMGSLVFIALGLFWVDSGVTTVDRLAAIYLLYGSMSWNFLQVGVYIPSMAEYLVNAKNVFTFLELEEEPECYHETAEGKGGNQCGNRNKEVVLGTKQNMSDNETFGHAVSMQKVTFAYEGREALFSDYDLAVPSGKYVVIKGESGKGKSTIMKLLLGLYPAITGEITVHGMDLRKTPLRKIREHIAYVPQEAYLYDVSIEKNIRWGNPHADRETVIRAAKLAHAHEFIMLLENEYETRVGERGSHLSGGQRQRIAIARALVKDADILILDEATSALDQGTEQLVTEEIKRQREGRTTIAITHRENAWQMADAVIEL